MDKSNKYQIAQFLICLINFLDSEIKERITYYLDSHFLDRALNQLIKENILPEWFSGGFDGFDPLYGQLSGLRDMFALALRSLLVEYIMGGGGIVIRLAISDRVARELIRRFGLKLEDVKVCAKRLNALLLEAEEDHRRFLAEQRAETMDLAT